jgi:hypothetical protein
MKCFWCSAPGVQHVDPCEPKCLGAEEEPAIDAGLERALQEVAEEARIAAEEDQ